ncbi:hypothetical protein [Phaeocystidibacter marisrubri]|uniref:T9SS type A sorting domain-containing protein n=1 Tax=Phaeocystidibacter marisrubri TaxID=1577780 RepID=A0A6L3ZDE7_9FLAO|nr:hypothetical protein [Phaeocystidibacter marisrubri]KAB2815690.1 hypothetical protein F8C82_08285 [Phaeocystidibacter marisrubri]
MLKQLESQMVVSQGINNLDERFFQVEVLSSTELEDWISSPDLLLYTPRGSYGYTDGEQVFHFPYSDIEVREQIEITEETDRLGYLPIMMFFPDVKDEFVSKAQEGGASLIELSDRAFTLTWKDRTMTFYPQELKIETAYSIENERIVTQQWFQLFAPYGYVESVRIEEITRTDLQTPVTFSTYSEFSNHVLEDPNSIVPKYTDQAFIQIHPNPIENEYEVVLKGIADDEVRLVQIRDYLGNVIHSHKEAKANNGVIELNGTSYPSGVLLILVYTQNGVYMETISKK